MIPIIAVIGTSKSGKTTLIEFLISRLSDEGLKIGTIKHVHHPGFSIDKKGKDTWRHSQAGAKTVVCVAQEEIAVIRRRKTSSKNLEEILNSIKDDKLDLLIIEGFHKLVAKKPNIFKVVTSKSDEDLSRTLEGTVDPILAISSPLQKRKASVRRGRTAILNPKHSREEILQLVRTRVLGM